MDINLSTSKLRSPILMGFRLSPTFLLCPMVFQDRWPEILITKLTMKGIVFSYSKSYNEFKQSSKYPYFVLQQPKWLHPGLKLPFIYLKFPLGTALLQKSDKNYTVPNFIIRLNFWDNYAWKEIKEHTGNCFIPTYSSHCFLIYYRLYLSKNSFIKIINSFSYASWT